MTETQTLNMTILPKKKTPGPKTDTETGSEHGHGQVGSYRRRVTNECPGGESHVLLPANDNKEPTKQMIFNLSNFRPIHWVCQNSKPRTSHPGYGCCHFSHLSYHYFNLLLLCLFQVLFIPNIHQYNTIPDARRR